MKRFLSMLALAVLVLQSVATSAVYATDIADSNEETVPEMAVETEVSDPVSDENSNEDVADFVDSTDGVENDESGVTDETDFDAEVEEIADEKVDEENVVEFAEEEMDEVIENETLSTSSSQSDYQEQTWTKISN